jgi:hypothetical protein
LRHSDAAGTGAITFIKEGIAAVLKIDGAAMPTNEISGFAPGDTIDLASIAFHSSGSATLLSGNVLQIVEGGNTYDLNLDPSQVFLNDRFVLSQDASGGTDITIVDPPPTVSATTVQSATITLNAPVTGTGSVVIDGGAVLDVAGTASPSQITFDNGSGPTYGKIIFGSQNGLNGLDATVKGFAGIDSSSSDIIDLAGTWTRESETSSSGNTTLVLADSANGGETLTLTFDNFNGSLNLASDGQGGTDIYDPPAAKRSAPSVSASQDQFFFAQNHSADTGSWNRPHPNPEPDQQAVAQLEKWAWLIHSGVHNDSFGDFVHYGDGDPTTAVAHWHSAFQNATHLH